MDSGKCIGRNICMSVCVRNAIERRAREALEACVEYGACARACPVGAIEVQPWVGCAHAIIKGMITGTHSGVVAEAGCDRAVKNKLTVNRRRRALSISSVVI